MSTTAVFYAPFIDDDNGVVLGNNSRCIFSSMTNNRLVKLSDISYEDFHASLPYHSLKKKKNQHYGNKQ